MLLWKRKQHVERTFEERLADLEIIVNKLRRDVVSCVMDIDTLRDKVLRKIQKKKEDVGPDNNGGTQNEDDGFNSIRNIAKKS